MVDVSRQVDFAGEDIVCRNLFTGANSPQTQGALGTTSTQYTLTGVNFNSATTDNAVTITLPTGYTTYRVSKLIIWGASHTLTTATVGIFGASSGGAPTILADSAITVANNTANTVNNGQVLTPVTTLVLTAGTIYVRVGTAEGAAATANCTVVIDLVG